MADRGRRLSRVGKQADLVLVDARYDADRGRLSLVRGYERRGDVWSDLLLLDRDSLIGRLRAGSRVFVGKLKDLPGDFELFARVHLNGESESIRSGANESEDLGLPIF